LLLLLLLLLLLPLPLKWKPADHQDELQFNSNLRASFACAP